MAVTIQIRRDTAADWLAANPVLAEGEMGVELDTGKQKLGDGTTVWIDLSYWGRVESVSAVDVTYDNSSSGLAASDAQGALDELDIDIEAVEAKADVNAAAIAAMTAIGAGRNLLINGDFSVWQRGTPISPTAGSYFSDRWFGSGTVTASRETDVPVDSGASFSMKATRTGGTTTVRHAVELGGLGLAGALYVGQEVTLSGWIKSAVPVSVQTWFADNVTIGNAQEDIPLTEVVSGDGSWQAFSLTHTVTGVPVGTNSCYTFNFLGGTDSELNMANMQFELGDTATDFEYVMPADQLARCQRYYEVSDGNVWHDTNAVSGSAYGATLGYNVSKRANPTLSFVTTVNTNFDAALPVVRANSLGHLSVYKVASKSGAAAYAYTFTADAEL